MLLIINSNSGKLFDGVSVDDLESVSYTHLTLPTKRIV